MVTLSPAESKAENNPCVLYFSPVPYFRGGAERSLTDPVRDDAVIPVVSTPANGPIQDAMRAREIEVHAREQPGKEPFPAPQPRNDASRGFKATPG